MVSWEKGSPEAIAWGQEMARKARAKIVAEAQERINEFPGQSVEEIADYLAAEKKRASVEKAKATRARNKAKKEAKKEAERRRQEAERAAAAPDDPPPGYQEIADAAAATTRQAAKLSRAAAKITKQPGRTVPVDPLGQAREELLDDPIFGPGISPKASRIAVHREPSPDGSHLKVKGISLGWQENLPFDVRPHLESVIQSRHGGGRFRVEAQTEDGRVVSRGYVTIGGRPKPPPDDEEEEDDEEEGGQSSMNEFFGGGMQGWWQQQQQQQEQRMAAIERMRREEREAAEARRREEKEANEARLSEVEKRMKYEREKEEARIERERIRSEERMAREASERRASEERMAQLQAQSQQAMTAMMTTMVQIQQSAQQQNMQMLATMMGNKSGAADDALKTMSTVVSGVGSMYGPLLEVLKASIDGAGNQSIAQSLTQEIVKAGPPLVEKIIERFPGKEERAQNRAAARILKEHSLAGLAEAQAQKQQAQQNPEEVEPYVMADGRVVPLQVAQAFEVEYRQAGIDVTREIIEESLDQWIARTGYQAPRVRPVQQLPAPESQPQPQPQPVPAPEAPQPPAPEPEAQSHPAPEPPGSEGLDKPSISKDIYSQFKLLFVNGISPFESVQYLMKRGKLTEAGRQTIGYRFANAKEEEPITDILMATFESVKKVNGVMPNLMELLAPFQEDEELGKEWIESFLWVCAQPSMEEAKASIDMMREASPEEEPEPAAKES